MLKCKLWNPSWFSPSIIFFQGCTLVIDGLHILDVLMGFQDFAMHFLDEALFQDVMHIIDLFLLGDAHVALGILSSCVTHQPFYHTWITFPSSFSSFLVGFDMRVMQVWGHYGSRIVGVFLGPFNETSGLTIDIF